jgi:hypothetical protein
MSIRTGTTRLGSPHDPAYEIEQEGGFHVRVR